MRRFQPKTVYILLGIILGLLVVNGLYRRFTSEPTATEEEILGEDANHDGVRDDVEKYIESMPAVSENVKKAMKQSARALQTAQRAVGRRDSAAAAREISRGVSCLEKMSPADSDDFVGLGRLIEAKMVNTPARSRRYIKFNASLSGMLLGAPRHSSCDFEKQRKSLEDEDDGEDVKVIHPK